MAVFAMALAALTGCSNSGGGETKAPSLVSITVETAKHVYIQGQDLDLDTITVAGIYSDGSEKPIAITSGSIVGYDKTKTGNQTITVTVEGQTAVFTVTVMADTDQAKEALEAALDAVSESIETIVVSRDGSDVPQGVPWITPAQKEELDEAIEAARKTAASDNISLEKIVETLEALQKAEKEAAAAAETQTGTKADWSYTVTFNNNGGSGTNPAAKTVASPDTTVGSLPEAPARSGYIFTGWNTRADGSESRFTETTLVAADITVYAQWTLIVNAQAPVISAHPRSASYAGGAAVTPLSVTAASRDGGTLSYQWHSRAGNNDEWTAISGAAESSYTPPTTAAGTLYYYVEVTNTNNDVNGTKTAVTNSSTAAITVIRIDAQAPIISDQPQNAAYLSNEQATALFVTATAPDGGELSYRWLSRRGANDEWVAISGATGSSYTPPITMGAVYYYVEVTNTNNDVNGTKTASINSNTVAITVAPVDAQGPIISVQPQDAAYALNSQAAPLSVTVEPPADGGTLSYQWHSRTAGSSAAPIAGATGTSYTPSTAATGTVYYYVLVTNTNNNVDGKKTTVTSSRAAKVMTNLGTSGFAFVWVTEGGSIVSDMPQDLRISRELEEHFVITAADGLTDLQWSLNGEDLGAPRGTYKSIIIEAVDYIPRNYTLTLRAKKDNVPYAINFTFVVVN
jgi:uncharacterized repeat protein (TIGR02543 family)